MERPISTTPGATPEQAPDRPAADSGGATPATSGRAPASSVPAPVSASTPPASAASPEDREDSTPPEEAQAGPAADHGKDAGAHGFRARGRMRRRLRFLRKARELAYRDLGGLVFNLHRFGERNDALVLAKLSALGEVDSELRELESALKERRSVTVLHEAGVTACPRCAAIHSGEDRFCPACGLPLSRHVDLPVASASGSPPADAPAPGAAAAAPTPGAPAPTTGAPARTPGAPAPTPGAPAPMPGAPASSQPATGGAPITPVQAPAQGQPAPIPPGGTRAPSAAGAEPPATPPAAPAVPSEDQPTKVLRRWRK